MVIGFQVFFFYCNWLTSKGIHEVRSDLKKRFDCEKKFRNSSIREIVFYSFGNRFLFGKYLPSLGI